MGAERTGMKSVQNWPLRGSTRHSRVLIDVYVPEERTVSHGAVCDKHED